LGLYVLALLHAFLPPLLWVLTEYGQDVLVRFHDYRDETTAAQPVPVPDPVPVPVPLAYPVVQATKPITATAPVPTPPPEPTPLALVPSPAGPQRIVSAPRDPAAFAKKLAEARDIRRSLIAAGKPAGRYALMEHMGIKERLAKQLVTQLNRDPESRAAAGGDR
jgi:hypothetical protein